MQKKTTTAELQQAFEDHAAVTAEQAKRLEQVFELLGKKAQAKKCDAMEGLNAVVYWYLEQAAKRAKANGRKTVRKHDFTA